MRRRDVAKILLASAAAPAVVAQRAQASSSCGTPACYPLFGNEKAFQVKDYSYPPGNVKRYGALGPFQVDPDPVCNLTGTRPDDRESIQAAIDSGAGEVYFPNGCYRIGGPLIIKPDPPKCGSIYSGGTQNLTFVGEGRTNTFLTPLKSDISTAEFPNALIVNQADNGKFSVRNMRFWSFEVEFKDGCAIYAVEAGAASQSIFSGSIDNCWFDLGYAATGAFRGALNNYRVSNCTFEFMNGCFLRDGPAMSDVIFSNNVMVNCRGAFYDGISFSGSNPLTDYDSLITIDGLHAYIHRGGQVIQSINSHDMLVSRVAVQSAGGLPERAAGLFKFVNCTNVICSNFNALKLGPVDPSGPLGEAITIQGSGVKLANGIIDGATFGIRIIGSNPVTLTVDNVDIVNSTFAPFAVQEGTPQGRVTVNNCNWSNSDGNLLTFTTSAAFDLRLTNCRLMNAGLANGGTGAGARNISIATSGRAMFDQCTIGRDTNSALASYFVNAAGTGNLTFRRTTFLGTAPMGTKTGGQTAFAVIDPAPTTL